MYYIDMYICTDLWRPTVSPFWPLRRKDLPA